ncbi:MAG TPA: MarR family transcriptional regulator [Solirubrobacteraceae bacterium]
MNSRIASTVDRGERLEYVSHELLQGAALLTRLLVRELGGDLSRTEVGLLNTVSGGPRRITELAELEGLAQPTTTILVQQLEERGLVRRGRDEGDGRVVLVHETDAGHRALEDYRGRAQELLGRYLNEMPDQQVEELAAAADAVTRLVTLVQAHSAR